MTPLRNDLVADGAPEVRVTESRFKPNCLAIITSGLAMRGPGGPLTPSFFLRPVKHAATWRAPYPEEATSFLNSLATPIAALVTLLQPEQRNTRKPSRSPIGDRSARWVIGAPQASHAQAGGLGSVLTGSGMAKIHSCSNALIVSMIVLNEA